jgi:uncharacterized iron-regulated membrane protein
MIKGFCVACNPLIADQDNTCAVIECAYRQQFREEKNLALSLILRAGAGMKARTLHRVLGIILLLPFFGWALTGLVFSTGTHGRIFYPGRSTLSALYTSSGRYAAAKLLVTNKDRPQAFYI